MSHVVKTFCLIADSATVHKLPGSVLYPVKETLMKAAVEAWPRLVKNCFEEVKSILQEECGSLLEQAFERFQGNGLLDAARSVLSSSFFGITARLR